MAAAFAHRDNVSLNSFNGGSFQGTGQGHKLILQCACGNAFNL
jgi:hypothetical protein